MSLSVAASPKEQIYTITESRWNEINLQVQTLTSEVLTLSDAFACSMLCCIFLGLTCTTLIITRFNLLGSICPVALFFGLFVSICLFSYRITLLLFLMFMVWTRWEDLNDWKRTMLQQKDQGKNVNAKPSTEKTATSTPSTPQSKKSDPESTFGDWTPLSKTSQG
ncbi:hypothetical protein D6C84_06366 [Aureobasidium pullulans]|uniref:Uncharacterized protein n=1 Tax=Aureobasidium pullulans TaxID=5580 RepID=A0A4S9XPB8_AURPU|nr:hypothetical protein D6C84_06366 [Aureobasidium pullulans]